MNLDIKKRLLIMHNDQYNIIIEFNAEYRHERVETTTAKILLYILTD
jgi:hypothetical protein